MRNEKREGEKTNLELLNPPLATPRLQLLRSGAVNALVLVRPVVFPHTAPKGLGMTRMAPSSPATPHRQNLGIKINLPFTPAERATLIHLLVAHEAVIRPGVVTSTTTVHFKVDLVAHDPASFKVEPLGKDSAPLVAALEAGHADSVSRLLALVVHAGIEEVHLLLAVGADVNRVLADDVSDGQGQGGAVVHMQGGLGGERQQGGGLLLAVSLTQSQHN